MSLPVVKSWLIMTWDKVAPHFRYGLIISTQDGKASCWFMHNVDAKGVLTMPPIHSGYVSSIRMFARGRNVVYALSDGDYTAELRLDSELLLIQVGEKHEFTDNGMHPNTHAAKIIGRYDSDYVPVRMKTLPPASGAY
ncbi:hypothetical protein BH11PSE2_BH11PSE2_04410 [soil metagenome]